MRLLERLIGFVAPYDCLVCGSEGAILCNWCRLEQLQPLPSRCAGCLRLSADYETCSKCQPRLRAGHIWVASEYAGAAREITRLLKFSTAREGAVAMARSIQETTPHFDQSFSVVPMPTITKHLRSRGFDHSKLLARRVAQYKRMKYLPALRRNGQTSQVGSSRAMRQKQIGGTMYVTSRFNLKGVNVLLVDDVMTTGASIGEATRALRAAGARKVYAAIFAQKVL